MRLSLNDFTAVQCAIGCRTGMLSSINVNWCFKWDKRWQPAAEGKIFRWIYSRRIWWEILSSRKSMHSLHIPLIEWIMLILFYFFFFFLLFFYVFEILFFYISFWFYLFKWWTGHSREWPPLFRDGAIFPLGFFFCFVLKFIFFSSFYCAGQLRFSSKRRYANRRQFIWILQEEEE